MITEQQKPMWVHRVSSTHSVPYFNQALARDNYRCIITGLYDMTSFYEYTKIENEVRAQGLQVVPTQAAHILPASTNKNVSVSDEGHPKV
jgi:hypothetical protein